MVFVSYYATFCIEGKHNSKYFILEVFSMANEISKAEVLQGVKKFGWDSSVPNTFRGLVKEYPTKSGKKLAVAFTGKSALIMRDDDDGYFYKTKDYTSKNGIFNTSMEQGIELEDYEVTHIIGTIITNDDETQYLGTDVDVGVLEAYDFAKPEEVAEDIKKRLEALRFYGIFTVVKLGDMM